jgi:SRSO17 transposase
LPETIGLQELVYWAKIRWWVEQNYQQLKDELGLDHFEGRSWAGWRHHVTLTMMAFDFLVLEGFRAKKNYWVDPPTRQKGTPTYAHKEAWLLPWLLASNHNR